MSTDDAWAAGFIDGDGCVRISGARSHGYRVRVLTVQADQVGSECPATLVRLAELYGGDVFRSQRVRKDLRPHWRWRVAGKAAEAMLRRIQPYAVGKREQIDLALEYRERGMGRGRIAVADEYESRMRALKRDTSPEEELDAILSQVAAAEDENDERWAAQRVVARAEAIVRGRDS